MIGIYKFTNKFDRKVYIGQSVNIEYRYKRHLYNSKYINTYFYNALRKYGIDGFDFEVLIECPKENLNYWEQFYIRYYCSNIRDYGYNMSDGGYSQPYNSGMKGKHHSEEAKEKNRQAHLGNKYRKGKSFSKESRKKISEANKGHHKHTTEWKEHMHNIMTGRHIIMPDGWRENLSKSHLGKSHAAGNKNKHKVWNDDTHTKYHFE